MRRIAAIFILLTLAGCSDGSLETGYQPHKLDATADDRRAFYASPYSPEAGSSKGAGFDPMMGSRDPSR